MLVTKCDICRKTIPDQTDAVYVGIGRWMPNRSLCAACGKPIRAFLARHHLAADGGTETKRRHETRK